MKNWKTYIYLSLICLIFVFLGVFSPSFLNQADAFSAGDGTSANPYQISTFTELIEFRDKVNSAVAGYASHNSAHYKLINHISADPTNVSLSTYTIDILDRDDDADIFEISNNRIVFKQTGEFYLNWQQNGTNRSASCFVVVKNVSSPEWHLIWNSPVGTATQPFTGYFDGNGKTILGIAATYSGSGSSFGLFGVTSGAEIKNLAVKTVVHVEDDGETVLNSITVGGLVGKATNTTIYNCKVNFDLSATRAESKYAGEVIAGGIVGYGEGLKLYQSAAVTRININQDGTNAVNSYFGGAVGHMDGGEIYFVYVAPSDNLVSKISTNGGVLTSVQSADADIKISSSKTESIIAFGGVVGYARNSSFISFNNVFSTLYYTSTPSKVTCGGIIGRISTNSSEHSANITYCKYLNVANAYISAFSSSIGNASAVSYTINSTLSSFNAMPTSTFYTSGSWKPLKDWDFTNTWKQSSIVSYGGYFFPNLQVFSTYNVKLSENNTVKYSSGSYNSGYFQLYFVNSSGNPIYESGTTFDTDMDFESGETVTIRAVFYNESENGLRDFKHYYDFTNWIIGETTAISVVQNGTRTSNGYTATTTEQSSTVSFTASSNTEGTYGINIVGENVTIYVDMQVESGTGDEVNFGSVNQKIGNNTVNKTAAFQISIENYQSGIGSVLEAVGGSDSRYVFARWADDNKTSNIAGTRQLTVKLDNARTSSSSTDYYATVVYDTIQEKLVAQITCYFSDNTSLLTLRITGGGEVRIDGGPAIISENHGENVVNNKNVTLTATASRGYAFKGWYVGDVLISTESSYITSISAAQTFEARFYAVEIQEESGLEAWVIAVIVVGSVLVVGAVILIIVKIKKNSQGKYKKNYRY